MKTLESLLQVFVELHPDEAAHALEALGADEAHDLFNGLPARGVAGLLARLSPQTAAPIVSRLDAERVGELLAEMSPRAASVVVHQLDEARREEVLSGLPAHVSRPLRDLAQYARETAGGIMEPRVAALPIDLSVEEAISMIRKTPRESLHYLYVTDRDGRLTGVLTMRDLLVAAPRDPIEKLVRRDVTSVPATMDREEVVNLMTERRFMALPVVDYDGRLIGVVRHNDALQAGQLEAFEDLQKIAGAGADERALSPVSVVVRSRLPWLMVNLATAFLAAAVVGLFEATIEQVAALAVLLPVVAGQGGNTGAQSLAVVIRGLALREIISGLGGRVVRKELLAGVINGVLVALVTSLTVLVWQLFLAQASPTRAMALAVVIGLAMVINMAAAALSGSVIPLMLKALGFDPAQSSSIFLTTVTDIVGFASFLGFAVVFLPLLK
ncbi:MAG: magnesium transporter [Planctomycetaceae bacterium]